MTIAIGRGDVDGLVGVGEIGWDGFGDVGDGADLDDGRLRLLENEFFVDGANLGGFFPRLLAADAVFFGRGQRNVMLEVADAGSVFRVNHERMFEALEVNCFALGVDFVFAVGLIPFGDGRVLVHVFDNLAPAYARVVRAEGDFALLRGVGNDAHFGAPEVVVEKI